jgi:hypothetical protein
MQDSHLRYAAQRGAHGSCLLGAYLDHHVRSHRAEAVFRAEADAESHNDPVSLQAFDPALHAGAGAADQSCELRGRGATILL